MASSNTSRSYTALTQQTIDRNHKTIISSNGVELISTANIKIHSINYPSTDGSLSNVISTNGAGALSINSLPTLYTRTVISTATYTVLVSDDIIAVTHTAGAKTITLPLISTTGYLKIHVVDEAGDAVTNNITISATSTDTINGASSALLNTDYSSMTLYNNNAGKWFIL